jgi:nicotinic acetylcholine receptor
MKAMKDIKERSSKSLLANVLDMDDDIRMSSSYLRMEASDVSSSSCALAQRDLQAILREIRFITARLRKAEDDAEVVGDWKFAAMVVDRMCLIVFTSFTIIATVAVLLSAPHIIVQ